MSSTSETGHAINIARYKEMGVITAGFNPTEWNPTNPDLLPASITAKADAAAAAHESLITYKASTKQPINERQIVFEALRSTVTRSLGYLNSTKASRQVKKDAKTLADDIRGANKPGRKKAAEPAPGGDKELDTISQSHQSYVQRVDRFAQYIALIKNIAEYTTKDAEISIADLEQYLTELQAANDGIGAILNVANLSLINRNNTLYAKEAGIFYVQKQVKEFAKGKFGAKDARFRLLNGLRFKQIVIV